MISSALLALVLFEPASAEAAGQRGDEYFKQEAYSEASAAYADAYSQDSNPQYLYAWAQSERWAGNCRRAVELYREYYELPEVSKEARDVARKNALRCGVDLTVPVEEAPDVEEPAAADAQPSAQPPPPPMKDETRRWSADPVAISLLAGGAGLSLAAIVLGVDRSQHRRLADAASIEANYTSELRRARRSGTAAIICASVGGAALVGAAIRYVIVARRASRSRATATFDGITLRF